MLPDRDLLWPAGETPPPDCLALVCGIKPFAAWVKLALKSLFAVLRPFSMVFPVVTHPAVLSRHFVLPMMYSGLPIPHSARGAIVLDYEVDLGGGVVQYYTSTSVNINADKQ